MEAANIGAGGAREADVAPAPATTESTGGVMAGWTPADPGPLGLAGFAATTFCLSMINANLVNITAIEVVLVLALAYGGIAQLIAGIWEFRTGNTFGAVAFCSYGAFWISIYFLFHSLLVLIPPGHRASAVGLYLWAWSIFTVYMFIASLRTSGAVALTFFLLTITFILLAIGNSALAGGTAATNNTIKLGGYFGIATAIAAWYASLAAVINSTFGRVIVPVFPLHRQ
jgi:succinate-acetate transporter protein